MPLDTAASASVAAWQYRIASLVIDHAEARLEDAAAPRRIELVVAPMHLHLKGLSSDLSEPIGLELDGALNHQGRFNITGTAVPAPLRPSSVLPPRRSTSRRWALRERHAQRDD
jgi:hypothetical protein